MVIMVVRGGNAFLAAGVSPSTLDEKENFDVAPNAAGAKNGKLGRRKMMEKVVMGKETEKLEEAMKGLAPKNSGANCFDGSCKLGARSSSSTQPVKGELGEGFLAFNADYNVPRAHPPKHN
ncbi:hypothetical protein RHMOL_Rhmol08G0043400 [Rhododendron molle]|uniref:Uncharacterized protein n=1 Tax=Rhododendron molle TaxID=49168 RepID=A0ACC0MLM9_RHOML|nr:hypothetical protein RHMOL_Rhmol08G0043400 [Rhododendron molle]